MKLIIEQMNNQLLFVAINKLMYRSSESSGLSLAFHKF